MGKKRKHPLDATPEQAESRLLQDTSQRHQVEELTVPTNSTSVAGLPLPPLPSGYDASDTERMGSILLFYQYKEPLWTETEFQKVLKKFLALGHEHSITGRGRIATEGVNCTLTGTSPHIRAFCRALRERLDPSLFAQTDFKITDNVPKSQMFKSLSMRKTDELVAYGLAHDKAPSIKDFGGTHLNAVDYHMALQDPNTVVIDVRNQYETAIGTIRPPSGGAKLIDPKLRNSHEWPKWLAAKETQQQLNGKKVMMFCTGGIRCERAAALVNQMAVVSASTTEKDLGVSLTKEASSQPFQPQGVFHMQGGIERYLKTFPEGGFWTGKNYLFDKRMEQLPEHKQASTVEQEVADKLKARCSRCRNPWTSYRGKYKCSQTLCGVPVIVCDSCHLQISQHSQIVESLQCELCREGYRAPQNVPDLVALRLKAEKLIQVQHKYQLPQSSADGVGEESNTLETTKSPRIPCHDRLFLSRLPLNVSRTQIQEWLQSSILHIDWMTDRETNAFYGSCVVQIDPKVVDRLSDALQEKAKDDAAQGYASLGPFPGTSRKHSSKSKQRRQQPKLCRAFSIKNRPWPPLQESEFPPLGHYEK